MRVLILSANTGRGYNATAQSLAEQMERLGMEYEVADALTFISDKASDFVSRWRAKIYKYFPKIFGMVYRYEEKHSVRFVYGRCAKGADALAKKLENGGYDAIVCVQIFAGMMLSEVRKRYGSKIPAYFVAPDYTSSPGVSELKMDGYFVPHRLLFADFVRSMIPADKWFSCGILMTMADVTLELTKEVESEIREHFGDIVYQTFIPRDVSIAEAAGYGVPVIEYAPRSRSARAYIELTMEILENEQEE